MVLAALGATSSESARQKELLPKRLFSALIYFVILVRYQLQLNIPCYNNIFFAFDLT